MKNITTANFIRITSLALIVTAAACQKKDAGVVADTSPAATTPSRR